MRDVLDGRRIRFEKGQSHPRASEQSGLMDDGHAPLHAPHGTSYNMAHGTMIYMTNILMAHFLFM